MIVLISFFVSLSLSANNADTLIQCSLFVEQFITEHIAIDHIDQQRVQLIQDFDVCQTSQLQNDGFGYIDADNNTLFVYSETIYNACIPHANNGTAITTIPGRETVFDAHSIHAIHADVQLQQAGNIDEIFLDHFGPGILSQSTSTDIAFVLIDLMTGTRVDTQYLEVIPGGWVESNMVSFDHSELQSTYWRVDVIPYGVTNPSVAAQHQWLKLDNIGVNATINNYCKPLTFGGSELIAYIPTCGSAGYYKYRLTYLDACKNWIEKKYLVEVVDTKTPGINCPVDVTVSANNACSYLYYVDADVYDMCSQVTVYAEYAAQDYQHPLGTYIELGHGAHEIVYIAQDQCDNTSTCKVTVTVMDDTPPTAICGPTVVSLIDDGTAKLYAASVDEGSHDNYCGPIGLQIRKMVDICNLDQELEFLDCLIYCCEETLEPQMVILRATDQYGNINDCMTQVTIQDKIDPKIICPEDVVVRCDEFDIDSIWGKPIVIDNCNTPKISKTYDTSDLYDCGNTGWYGQLKIDWSIQGTQVTCSQAVEVQADLATEKDISWPMDYIHDGCIQDVIELDPSVLPHGYGVPVFSNNTCQKYVSSYQDAEVYFGPNGPGIGICKKYIRTWTVISWCGYSSFEYRQVLKIKNNNPPRFGSTPRDTVLCSYDKNCQGLDHIKDIVSYIIDDDCGSIATYFVIDETVYDDSTFPTWWNMGQTQVTVVATDQCHNTSSAEFVVDVQDCKAPNGYCQPIHTTLNNHQQVELWASDIASGEDNCTASDDLMYSFSEDLNDSVITFYCDDIGTNTILVYIWDQEGNRSACSTYVQIEDNQEWCPDVGARGTVQGSIHTIDGTPIINVLLEIPSGMSMCLDGEYMLPLEVEDKYIRASKDTDFLYGVSTLDLLKIQKHILGEEIFEHWWQYIAADINNDGTITAIDLIELRKLILGIVDVLPHNDSYQFFELGLEQAQVVMIDSKSENVVNFVGIKIGDVDGTSLSIASDDPEVLNLLSILDNKIVADNQTSSENGGLDVLRTEATKNTATVETNKKMDTGGLKIYPNPVENMLNIESNGVFLYQILDMRGEVFRQGKSEDAILLDVQSLPGGIYPLKITRDDKVSIKTFIKI